MLKLHLAAKDASISRVLKKLGITRAELDPSFGLVALDPDKQLYAVLVDEKVADRLEGSAGIEAASNPKIETFGQPK